MLKKLSLEHVPFKEKEFRNLELKIDAKLQK